MKYFDASIRDPHQLKAEYRKLVFRLHPDVGGTKEEFQAMYSEYEALAKIIEQEANCNTSPNPTNKQKDVLNGFDWELDIKPVFDHNKERIPGYKAIYHSETRFLLNLAKSTYTPTTNAEFTEMVYFLRDLTGGEIQHFTSLSDGRKVLAHIKQDSGKRIGNYEYDKYLVVGNAHDYSSAFFIGSTDIMLRCENQFTAFNKQLKSTHTLGHKTQLREIKTLLTSYNELDKQIASTLGLFEKRHVTSDEKNGLIRKIFNIPKEQNIAALPSSKQNQITALNAAIMRETKALGQNALGLFNGITYYTTHVQKQKTKVFGNVFGATAENNTVAFEYCKELIK